MEKLQAAIEKAKAQRAAALAKQAAEAAGYSSLDDFIVHVLEREITKHEQGDVDKDVADRRRGRWCRR